MNQYDNIEKYALGELSPEEKNVFEKQLSTDKKLVEELAAYRKNELAIKAAARKQLRKTAGTAYAKINQNNRVVIMRRLAVAAGFLIMVAAGVWWMNQNNDSSEELYAQYFEMPAPPSVRNGNATLNPKWELSINIYGEGRYEFAIPIFQELLVDENFNQKETVKLLLGTSLLYEGEFDEAIKIFNQINEKSTFRQDAEWYTALVYLKSGNRNEAKNLFENISNQKRHYKKLEAKEFLKSLK